MQDEFNEKGSCTFKKEEIRIQALGPYFVLSGLTDSSAGKVVCSYNFLIHRISEVEGKN